MTVSQLVHILQQYPADMRVLVERDLQRESYSADIGEVVQWRCGLQPNGLWEDTTGALEQGKTEECIVLQW